MEPTARGRIGHGHEHRCIGGIPGARPPPIEARRSRGRAGAGAGRPGGDALRRRRDDGGSGARLGRRGPRGHRGHPPGRAGVLASPGVSLVARPGGLPTMSVKVADVEALGAAPGPGDRRLRRAAVRAARAAVGLQAGGLRAREHGRRRQAGLLPPDGVADDAAGRLGPVGLRLDQGAGRLVTGERRRRHRRRDRHRGLPGAAARVHDQHAVGHARRQPEVVGDEQDGRPGPFPDVVEDGDHQGLDGDGQRGGGRVRAGGDFPEPDSPTMASTSPRAMSKDTPSAASTTPAPVRNHARRPRTESRGRAITGGSGGARTVPRW